jgi:hypothetical protein
MRVRPDLFFLAMALLALACKATESSPDGVTRAVWASVVDGDAKKLRELYPSAQELQSLFEPDTAARLASQIDTAVSALSKRASQVQLVDAKILKETDVAAGSGLLQKAHLAKVHVALRVLNIDTDDDMALVRVGDVWRALPKEALKLIP